MLSREQVESYHENGFLHIPQVFTETETDELSQELDRLVQEWAFTSPGWEGSWRQAYMDPEVEKKSKLTFMHDLQFYSDAWCRAVTNARLAEALSQLIGPDVELHHSTLHIKPPESGHPFPMHQDYPFYPHENGQYVDVLVHLDDTSHENGEIRFLAGSHKHGRLPHLSDDGRAFYLSPDVYKLENSVPVPAKRGDVVCFSIFTVHGSHINRTKKPRRLVRVGYRDPQNSQLGGQSHGRPGLMVRGYRERRDGQPLLKTD